ncbi:MAG TPA: FAD-dependent oxidoreductase [Actinophytocola sp.]|nr:FAD-dependent oxidoreductase [Actinophytocola sp.]
MTDIAAPGEAGYEAAAAVFNLAAPPAPAAAVTATTVGQVQAAVRHAAGAGLSVRMHTTGHAAPTFGPMTDALLIRTALAGQVEVDPARRVARMPAGTLWGAVVEAAAEHGLGAAHGTSPTVGVVGYLLRGGVSFYGREVGLAVNAVRSVDLVTADGELRRVDAETDPELFWALRGGGGGFGVVTAVEIDLFPVSEVYTGAAFWPAVHAFELISRWRRWTVDAPSRASTSVRMMNLPPMPGRPPEVTSGPVICIDGAVLGADADDLLGPLHEVAAPVLTTWRPTTATAVLKTHMDPPVPVPSVADHMLLTDVGVESFIEATGPDSGSPLVSVELRQLGGAMAVPSATGGALSHLPGSFVHQAIGVPLGPVTVESIRSHFAKVRSALARWDTGPPAPNFVTGPGQSQAHLTPSQIARANQVRDRVDPTGLFRADAL